MLAALLASSTCPAARRRSDGAQVNLRHLRRFAYRCSLPGLAGFTRPQCTGLGPRKPDQSHIHGCNSTPSNCIVAERVGFEPTVRCRTHAFQACTLSHSVISPNSFGSSYRGIRSRRGNSAAMSLHGMAERVGFEPTCLVTATKRFRGAPVMTTSVPLLIGLSGTADRWSLRISSVRRPPLAAPRRCRKNSLQSAREAIVGEHAAQRSLSDD